MQQEHHYKDYDKNVLVRFCEHNDFLLKECRDAFEELKRLDIDINYTYSASGRKIPGLLKRLKKYLNN